MATWHSVWGKVGDLAQCLGEGWRLGTVSGGRLATWHSVWGKVGDLAQCLGEGWRLGTVSGGRLATWHSVWGKVGDLAQCLSVHHWEGRLATEIFILNMLGGGVTLI